jgi:hypothetical protein
VAGVFEIPPGTVPEEDVLAEGAAPERFLLLDTAGVSRSARRAEGVAYYSTLRTVETIRRSDVSLLLVDAVEGLVGEDLRLASRVEEAGRACGVLAREAARDRGRFGYPDDGPETPDYFSFCAYGGGNEEGDAARSPVVLRVQPEGSHA